MQKILVVSDSIDSSTKIRNTIERDLPYQVFVAYEESSLRAQLDAKLFGLVILDTAVLSDQSIKLLNILRTSSYSFPIIVTADKVPQQFHGRIALLTDLHMLVRPFNERNILGLIRKLFASRKVPKQQHRRFNTNQIAQIESFDSGNNLLTSMYNLSQGGAYCEFDSSNILAVGDLIRMRVTLSDTSSEYTFNAKVIWTVSKGRFSGRFGCGFKFVGNSEVHRGMASS